jgi:uncharacterized membrane protein YgdD (TMEM256/DUF423 family)
MRFFFAAGALLAGLAVAMGAATGHQTSTMNELAQAWVAKGSRYQFYHGLAMIAVAMAMAIWPEQRGLFVIAGSAFFAGTLLFAGSLYFMAFTGISAGYLTPLGGLGFLAGWLAMVLAGTRISSL